MDIRTLRYFVEVVRQQSFTRAAEKLFVTQPTISKMLKNLEDELNCTLLIRDGRKLLLTDTGRVVFERGQAILGEFHQLESELSDINHLHKGVLRLGIPPMVGMLMAEPISRFRQRYAGIELKIAEFGGLTVQQAVSNGELDLAMTALPVDEASGLTTLSLFSHPLCVLTPRTAQWESIASLSPQALAAYPLVIYNEDFALSQQLMRLLLSMRLSRASPYAADSGIFWPPWCRQELASRFCRNRFASVSTHRAFAGSPCRATCAGSWG